MFETITLKRTKSKYFKTLFQNFSIFIEFYLFNLLHFSWFRAEYYMKLGNWPLMCSLWSAYSFVYSIRLSCLKCTAF